METVFQKAALAFAHTRVLRAYLACAKIPGYDGEAVQLIRLSLYQPRIGLRKLPYQIGIDSGMSCAGACYCAACSYSSACDKAYKRQAQVCQVHELHNGSVRVRLVYVRIILHLLGLQLHAAFTVPKNGP